MSREEFALWLIVVQGFFVMWWEYATWKMNWDRYKERKQWRLAKQNAKLKKVETSDGLGKQNSQ
jgi:hypothetical protein